MADYPIGFEYVREPDRWLETGAVVPTHKHRHHHNTHLIAGLWKVRRWQPIVDGSGGHKTDAAGEQLWHELEEKIVRGGGPGSILPIPKDMRHEFTVLEGPAFYRCVFAHRDSDGNVIEHTEHYESAYV